MSSCITEDFEAGEYPFDGIFIHGSYYFLLLLSLNVLEVKINSDITDSASPIPFL